MVVSHAAGAAVLPQGEDLPDDCHAPQCTVGKLQDFCVTDFLQHRRDKGDVVDVVCCDVCVHVGRDSTILVFLKKVSCELVGADFSSVVK